MIIVQVQHFLNVEGQQRFPTWLGRMGVVLSRFEGFISIRQIQLVNKPQECYLLIEFESVELLRNWVTSKAHDDLIAQLAPFSAKPQESRIFEVGPRLAKHGSRTESGILSKEATKSGTTPPNQPDAPQL